MEFYHAVLQQGGRRNAVFIVEPPFGLEESRTRAVFTEFMKQVLPLSV